MFLFQIFQLSSHLFHSGSTVSSNLLLSFQFQFFKIIYWQLCKQVFIFVQNSLPNNPFPYIHANLIEFGGFNWLVACIKYLYWVWHFTVIRKGENIPFGDCNHPLNKFTCCSTVFVRNFLGSLSLSLSLSQECIHRKETLGISHLKWRKKIIKIWLNIPSLQLQNNFFIDQFIEFWFQYQIHVSPKQETSVYVWTLVYKCKSESLQPGSYLKILIWNFLCIMSDLCE